MNTDFPQEDRFLDFEGNERVFDYQVSTSVQGIPSGRLRGKVTGMNFHHFQHRVLLALLET